MNVCAPPDTARGCSKPDSAVKCFGIGLEATSVAISGSVSTFSSGRPKTAVTVTNE